MAQNLYVILGVDPDAEPQQITRAFRRLIRTLHPDAAPEPQLTGHQESRERFEQVVDAYRVLHNPAARAAYDRDLAAAPSTAPRPSEAQTHLPRGGSQPPLVAGATVIHARPSTRPDPYIRIGPPIRLDD